ncbi:response regulator [Acanthopleuribacter pedis]|uniref:Sensory/regulatory protein RpfC n=1 Tax=Acanthopleuribacter pedis TaxID=442870 RepID=A0A8J7Q7R0_9BACT|nr:response regulator [Acanthopleuribacter pedis]MBO1318394.1 response regulator [Acanthopleuribacter pedis]
MQRNFISLTGLFLLLSVLLMWRVGLQNEKQVVAETEARMNELLQTCTALLEQQVDAARGDVRFLSATPPMTGISRAMRHESRDPVDGTPLSLWRERLAVIFEAFLAANDDLAQARLIGVEQEGMELVRVDHHGGVTRRFGPQHLQSKQNEPYFQDALATYPGTIRLSDINLNREHGKVEFPAWPTFRVSTKVVDEEGAEFGILIVNVAADQVLNRILSRVEAPFKVYLVKSNGEFVLHPEKRHRFAIQNGDGFDLGQEFSPIAHKNNRLQVVENLREEQTYRVVRHLFPFSSRESGRHLTLLLGISEADLSALVEQRRQGTLSALGGILAAALVFLVLLQLYYRNRLRLGETREAFEALVNSSSDAIIAMDVEGRITSWNRAAVELFGFKRGTVLGRLVWEMLKPKEEAQLDKGVINRVVAGEHGYLEHVTMRTATGNAIEVALTLSPIRKRERVSGVSAILRNVTEKRRAEAKIRELNQSLEQQVEKRTRELDVAREKAERASDAKSSFVANVSHEIRTPLNGILGMLQLMEDEPLSRGQARYLHMAQNSAQTLLMLINEVLDLSKIEAGKLAVNEVAFDLPKLLGELSLSMALAAQEKGLELVLDIAEVTVSGVVGDPHRLKQVLANLIGNAVKFTEEGHILIRAKTIEKDAQWVLACSVEDTGIGIAANKMDKVFGEFDQEDSDTARRYGGTGLGLAICRKLVEMMGGRIWVESQKGSGTRFSFEIVVKVSRFRRDARSIPDLQGKKVLLAEDNPAAREALCALLNRCGAEVTAVTSAADAVHHLQDHPGVFDLAFIDFSLPDLYDSLLLLYLAESRSVPASRVFVAMPQNSDVDATVLGKARRITKPITPTELFHCLGRPERAVRSERDDASAVGKKTRDLGLAPDASILVVDDNQINREVLKGLLKKLALPVVTAGNGREALAVLLKNPQVVLALMDCNMPVMNGYEVTREIRGGAAGDGMRSLPIIAVTANAMEGEQALCLQAGMNDYLSKPVQFVTLEDKLAYWLGIEPRGDQAELEAALDSFEVPPQTTGLSQALANVAGDKKLLASLMQTYLDWVPGQVRALGEAVARGDMANVRQVAHAVKGAASNVGALGTAKLAQALYEAAGREPTVLAEVQEVWAAFERGHSWAQKTLEEAKDQLRAAG